MKAYQAWANNGSRITDSTPKGAAQRFFAAYPEKRKCNISEGESNGGLFTVTYNLRNGERPRSWQDVTKKMVESLHES